jgi:hypothetical protein
MAGDEALILEAAQRLTHSKLSHGGGSSSSRLGFLARIRGGGRAAKEFLAAGTLPKGAKASAKCADDTC